MMATYGPMRSQLAQLFAFGIDSYRLSQQLQRLQDNPLARIHGATGSLSMTAGGRITRRLGCARFTKGIAQALPRKQAAEFNYGASAETGPARR